MKNWKTTIAGIIVAGVAAATALHWITPEVATAILGAAASAGLIAAADAKKPS